MDWRPTASLEMLRRRAALLARLRTFFAERGVLEVETPLLSSAASTDPQIESFSTIYSGPGAPTGQTLYLHTSPEFAMKRLLAAGCGPIYQICKVFRQGEAGRHHNPEFTLLEWYRPGFDHHRLMREVEELIAWVIPERERIESEYLTYRQAFERHADLDPFRSPTREIRRRAALHGLEARGLEPDDRDGWLDLLMTHRIQPRLGKGRLTFLFDYPASQAALARIEGGDPPLAARFELFLEGMELANGFHELTDAEEQEARFLEELRRRKEMKQPQPSIDRRFLAALRHGLPDCAGVALGVDRLLMLSTGASHIHEVTAFPVERA